MTLGAAAVAAQEAGRITRAEFVQGWQRPAVELDVLALEFTQAIDIGRVHAAAVGVPDVRCRKWPAEAAFAAQFLDRQADFSLLMKLP